MPTDVRHILKVIVMNIFMMLAVLVIGKKPRLIERVQVAIYSVYIVPRRGLAMDGVIPFVMMHIADTTQAIAVLAHAIHAFIRVV